MWNSSGQEQKSCPYSKHDGAAADLVGQGRDTEVDALARVTLGLTVERLISGRTSRTRFRRCHCDIPASLHSDCSWPRPQKDQPPRGHPKSNPSLAGSPNDGGVSLGHGAALSAAYRDASYGQAFRDRVEAMAIKEVVTAAQSPWQNPLRRARPTKIGPTQILS